MATITLSVRGQQVEFTCTLAVDGRPVGGERHLPAARVAEAAERYAALLAGGAEAAQLAALGADLFDLWLKDHWAQVLALVPQAQLRQLLVASSEAAVLNLPWELLRPPGQECLGLDKRFAVRRAPWLDRAPGQSGSLRPRPLRVLFMACSPKGEATLDFEREEQLLYEALSGPNVALETCDMGTFDELKEKIDQFQPHIVHLSGHGALGDDGLGYFAFEDEQGEVDSRPAAEIGQLMAGSGVVCAFISGCESAASPPVAVLGGICQNLVSQEVPLAIGWAAPISDDLATRFAREFYRTAANGRPVDQALTDARKAIEKQCGERRSAEWTLPVLYASSEQGLVVDPARPLERLDRKQVVQLAIPGMAGTGFARHFVGRRREQQRLLPALRSGELQLLLLTGVGGVGKSTLATRLARKLEADGYRLIAISSSKEVPLTAASLLDAAGRAFMGPEFRADYGVLLDANLPVGHRLSYFVGMLNRHRCVLILDNFETSMAEESRAVLDGEVAGFFRLLLSDLAGESRVILTSRCRPAVFDSLRPGCLEETLGDFGLSSFLKFLLRDPAVERRHASGQLPHALLTEMWGLLGGTPRFLEQVRAVLGSLGAQELEQELAALRGGAPQGLIQAQRDAYLEQIFVGRLFAGLSAEAQGALCRAAVFAVPVTMEGLSAASGMPAGQMEGLVEEWQARALVYQDRERGAGELWSVYGMLRSWLLKRLDEGEVQAAHEAAGAYFEAVVKEDRQGDLALTWVEGWLQARRHYLQARRFEDARQVTNRVAAAMMLLGLYEEVVDLNQEMLSFEEHPGPMGWIGRALIDLGRYTEARAWYQRSLDAAGDRFLEEAATAWHGLGTVDLIQGNLAKAEEYFQQALQVRVKQQDLEGQAATLHQLAMICLDQGNLAEAQMKFQQALQIRRELGDQEGEAAALHGLASIDLTKGDLVPAQQQFQTAYELRVATGDLAGQAATLHQLASIEMRLGAHSEALAKFRSAMEIKWEIGDRRGQAATFYQLGLLAKRLGRGEPGIRLVALGYWINLTLGISSAERDLDFRNLTAMASDLGYSQKELTAVIQEVREGYEADQGRALVRAAFAGNLSAQGGEARA